MNNDCSWAKYLTRGDVANHPSISVWHGINSTNQIDRRRALPPAEQTGKLLPNAQALLSLVYINHASRCQKLLSNTGIDPLSVFKLIRQSRHQTVSLHRARFVSSQILRHLNLSVAEMSSDLKWQTTLSSTRISKWCYCRNWIVSVFLLSCSFLLQISFGWRFFALLDSAWWLRGRCYQ